MREYSIIHGLIGVFATCLAITLHVSPYWTFWGVLALGVAHEVYDGDFRPKFGGPFEGVKDALSFLFPGPFLYLLLVR